MKLLEYYYYLCYLIFLAVYLGTAFGRTLSRHVFMNP